MSLSPLRLFVVIASLIALPSAAWAQEISGRWSSDFGPIEIRWDESNQNFAGSYSYKGLPAEMHGGLDAETGVWEGYWIQETSEVACNTTRDGSPYWGRFRLLFKGDRFLGLWNYCDRRLVNDKRRRWTGNRQ